jgi:pimeloyl-ACP methyl ester carboxylesterase
VSGIELREVVLHGQRMAYRMCGDPADGRPVLLLVHGLAGSSDTWEDALELLGDRFTVVAPDLPGHGGSTSRARHDYSLGAHAGALRDLLVALGIDRASLIGHSLGGGVALQFAYQHPERCERLVLVSSGGLGPEVSWLLRALALPGAELLMPVLFPAFVRDAGNAVGRTIGRLGLRWPRVEHEWRAYASLADGDHRQPFLRTLRSVIDPGGQVVDAHDRLYLAAHLPTLVVWGRRDRMIPVEHAAAAQASLPSSELVVFDGAGHFPHVEQPAAFVDAVTRFVEGSAPATWDDRSWRELLTAGTA